MFVFAGRGRASSPKQAAQGNLACIAPVCLTLISMRTKLMVHLRQFPVTRKRVMQRKEAETRVFRSACSAFV